MGSRRIRPRGSRLAWLAAVVVTQACSDSLGPEDFEGTWAAEGVRLTLAPTHAFFETSCWHGELSIPLDVKGEGFESLGTIVSQGGAGMSETRFATFAGRRTGTGLHLEVRPASLGLGPYDLTLDAQVEIPGCPQPASAPPP